MTDNALGQDLAGRLAVVTGGAQGIGRSIVEALAEAGARLVVADLNPETGERTAAEVGAEFVRIDVTSSASVSQVVADLVGAHGSIDVWVNNASIDRNAAGEEMSERTGVPSWRSTWTAPSTAVARCADTCWSAAAAAASSSTSLPCRGWSPTIRNLKWPTTPSKAGVIMMTKSLAGEWASHGVRIDSLSPGYTATAILDQVIEQQPKWTESWFRETPMGRPARTHEVAAVVRFLASGVASFMSGSNVVVDGGYTCW